MTGFSTDWLALREPFDQVAREEAASAFDLRTLARRLRAAHGARGALDVLDLACGTGANLRELAPRLGGHQRWLLVDHDPLLLAALPGLLAAWSQAQGFALRARDGCLHIEGADWRADLRVQLADLALALDRVPFTSGGLVTASALLDLVSGPWLEALLARVRVAGAAALFALTVDGRVEWTPACAGDEAVQRLFASHQQGDKGFGAALGCDAAAFAAQRLAAIGYEVVSARSDWSIEGGAGGLARRMLRAMVEGTASAALAQAGARALVDDWTAQRLRRLADSRLRLGHVDLLAWPSALQDG